MFAYKYEEQLVKLQRQLSNKKQKESKTITNEK